VTPAITTLAAWGERFLAARIDLDANTTKNYRAAIRKIGETFGDRDVATITAVEVAEWIASLAAKRKRGALQQYLIAFRLLLDHADVDPNPARDPRVKLPKRVREEVSPPPAEHVLAILEQIHDPRRRLLFIVIEQGALRLGEAVGLRWGDIDRAGLRLRLRLRASATKRDRARWVYLPEWLMDASRRRARWRTAPPSGWCSRG
jgi:integrase